MMGFRPTDDATLSRAPMLVELSESGFLLLRSLALESGVSERAMLEELIRERMLSDLAARPDKPPGR